VALVGGGGRARTRVKAKAFFALLLVPAALSARGFEATWLAAKWTKSDPPINLLHIDYGEINRHGEAVGSHPPGNSGRHPGSPGRLMRAASIGLASPSAIRPLGCGSTRRRPPPSFLMRCPTTRSSRRSLPPSRSDAGAATVSSSALRAAASRSRGGTRTGGSM